MQTAFNERHRNINQWNGFQGKLIPFLQKLSIAVDNFKHILFRFTILPSIQKMFQWHGTSCGHNHIDLFFFNAPEILYHIEKGKHLKKFFSLNDIQTDKNNLKRTPNFIQIIKKHTQPNQQTQHN